MDDVNAEKNGEPKLLGTIETSKPIVETSIPDDVNLSELIKRPHGGGEDDAEDEERHRKKKKKVDFLFSVSFISH